jgi:hypothetical protein
MAENVDNIVLVQLREMREEMGIGFTQVNDRLDNLEAGQQALQGVLFGLGRSVQLLENRVEHIEEKLGIE